MWFNYSVLVNDNLSSAEPLFWSRPTPISCDVVRITGIVLCLCALLGIMLNGLLLYSFIRYQALRTSSNIYVMFIATLGLVASCTILPLTGTSSIYCRWLYTRRGCQLSAAMAFVYGCSSSYLLCAVSLCRCYIIVCPFKANAITVKKSTVASCFAVLTALVWAALPLLGWNEYTMEGARTSCCINWYDRRWSYVSFTYSLFVFVYFIPLVILIVCNSITLLGLKSMHDKIEHGISTSLSRKRIQMERRIVKSIIITTCGFILTWTPYAITLFVSAFQGKDYAIPPLATFLCACFAKSSVIWIPLLYISTSTHYQFHFVNVAALHSQPASTQQDNDGPQKLIVVHNDDGSINIRPIEPSSSKRKIGLTTSNASML